MTDSSQRNTPPKARVTRRGFLKSSTLVGTTAALAATGVKLRLTPARIARADSEEKIVWQACLVNCGCRCPLRVTVRDGKIVRVQTDNTGTEEFGNFQVRACLRGRSVRKRIYNEDRLQYPMKRVGVRGEGKFERITWEEAFDTIANSLKHVKETYGNEAIYINYATGTLGGSVAKSWPPASSPIARLMNCYGGYLNHYGTYSTAQISTALPYTYGSGAGNALDDTVNSKLIVFWGNNPVETRQSGINNIYYKEIKQRSGAKIIIIDPRLSDSCAALTDEWVPLRPGTDAALVSGLAYVMISENLVDQEFLDKYCVGYDEEHMPPGIPANNSYKSYILGLGADKTPKTPEWASSITGVPKETIVRLAREMALTKPCAVFQGWGPQRQANGEQNCRAIAMIPILTGNVGIAGGNTGAREGAFSIPVVAWPTLTNPVKASISVFMWPDAIARGKEMTATRDGVRGVEKLSQNIKFIWNYAGNCLINQHSAHGETAELLKDDTACEMIVVIDNHMTSSAKFADILLPDTSNFEQDDITSGGAGAQAYAIFCSKAIEPMYECRTIYDMCTEIARRLGIEQEFTEGKTQEEWLRYIVDETRKKIADFPDFETFKQQGIYKVKNPGAGGIALRTFREDPVANPLTTPTGKIEIFSERLYTMGLTWELPKGDVITGLPEYTPTWEMPTDPLHEKYPLQMISPHYKQRTHSTYGNDEWTIEAAPQNVWINPLDAQARGVKQGDLVRILNDRGVVELPAKVTPRIIPGVVAIPQGAWYEPDSAGVDTGGSANTLTAYRPSPLAKGNPQHTNLVQVEKA